MAKLLIFHPDKPLQELELRAFNTLGRHPKQTIQIDDRVVSKEHALITLAEDLYWIQDIGSRNGTFVNGDKIKGRTKLNSNDVIRLGSTQMRYINEQRGNLKSDSILFHKDDIKSLSSIRSRIDNDQMPKGFRPEREIVDITSLRADYEKLRAVFELHEAAGDQMDLDTLLDRILSKIFELVNASRGVILLEDEDGNLEPRSFNQVSGQQEDFHLSQTILQEVREKRAGILSDDARLDSRFEESKSIVMQGIRSIMCVPLVYGNEFLGAIYLDTQFATGVFTEKDLQMIAVFANQASAKIITAKLARTAEQEAVARTQLSRLLSPNLVEEVVKGHLNVNQGGTLVDASVLFADIRGFTRLSERMAPQDLISTLNEYFEIMVEIIFKYDGTLDKFIGDEIMAVWGAPIAQEDHGLRAMKAAYEIREALERFNRFRVANGDVPLKIGIGINSGQMVAGYLGSSKTLSYTVLGDVVNVAARLCSHAQPGEILVSDPLYPWAQTHFEYDVRPAHTFKGKSSALGVYQLKGLIGGTPSQDDILSTN